MPRLKPATRDDLVIADFGDELVICKPGADSSELHYLSSTATLVFRLCDGTGTPAELAADIADAYGIPIAAVERDVRDIVRQFRRNGMLTVKPVVRRRSDDHEHHTGHQHSHEDHQAEDERELILEEEPEHD